MISSGKELMMQHCCILYFKNDGILGYLLQLYKRV